MLNNFDFNKKQGVIGLIFVSVAISLFCFSVVYLVEAVGWYSSEPDIYRNWLTGSGIMVVVGVILMIVSAWQLRRSKVELVQKKRKIDFNSIKGFGGVVMIPVGLVFAVQAVIYRIESARWVLASFKKGKIWYLTEATSWNNSALVVGLIGIGLICGGAFLLILAYKKGGSPVGDKKVD